MEIKKRLIYTVVLAAASLAAGADSNQVFLGDQSDGSRAVPVHLIGLFDEDGEKILPDDKLVMPLSTKQTCGACHDYNSISGGWHFNSVDSNVPAGRSGQAWIYVDSRTATVIPLSYRNWAGTFRPEQAGLSAWQFTQLFGRQMPGGGPGELGSNNPDEIMRTFVSGKLEINCLACHSRHPGQDGAEYADQTARQNFRWAATGASGLATVTGIAKDMPDTYDYKLPTAQDNPPSVTYHKDIFDKKEKVLFDVVRKAPVERCYFCHSNIDLNTSSSEKWAKDEDVHLAGGLLCVDCHRNGLEHNITRGYEGEEAVSSNKTAAVSSCRGCHLPLDACSIPGSGRMGAPVPEHRGIPVVHFDKLSCTACHSGPWPAEKTLRTKTSRAHGLGTHNVNKSNDALPYIETVVFARRADGKIGPHKLIWPAYWGNLKGETVTPIAVETVRTIAGSIITGEKPVIAGNWPELTVEQVAAALSALSLDKFVDGKAVYIAGGKLYSLDDKGGLVGSEHEAARPYLWPIAHDVRPAAQSLGVRACQDCHSISAPFLFGEVAVDSPIVSQRGAVRKMVEFEVVNPAYMKFFAFTFVFRPWLKAAAIGACAILGGILVLYALKALAFIAKTLGGSD